ncbi:hypothetical protein [Lysobacter brunescens]|uniref:Uncharacterized protein n=1 Tax=Lysobacter brunescens TaxID=262323 RepID=A0ABW2YDG1_9GAMM
MRTPVSHAHAGQPGVAGGQPARFAAGSGLQEGFARVLRRAAGEGEIALVRQTEAVPDRAAQREQRARIAAVAADFAHAGLDAFVGDEHQTLAVAPLRVGDVTLQARQHVAEVAAILAGDHQPALLGIVPVLGGNEGELRTVGAPRQAADLAGILDLAQHLAVGRDDAHAGEHQGVVGELARRDQQGDAITGGAPGQRLDAALDRHLARLGLVAVEIDDPQANRRPVLFVDLLGEALLLQTLEFIALRLACQQRGATAIGRQAEGADVGLELGDHPGFTAAQRDAVQRPELVALALGEVGDAAGIRHPRDRADVHLAGDEAATGAVAVGDMQFGPGRPVVVDAGLALHRQRVGDLPPVRADLGLRHRPQLGDLIQCHARLGMDHADQRQQRAGQQYRHRAHSRLPMENRTRTLDAKRADDKARIWRVGVLRSMRGRVVGRSPVGGFSPRPWAV